MVLRSTTLCWRKSTTRHMDETFVPIAGYVTALVEDPSAALAAIPD
jgi:hypothetical protein